MGGIVGGGAPAPAPAPTPAPTPTEGLRPDFLETPKAQGEIGAPQEQVSADVGRRRGTAITGAATALLDESRQRRAGLKTLLGE